MHFNLYFENYSTLAAYIVWTLVSIQTLKIFLWYKSGGDTIH